MEFIVEKNFLILQYLRELFPESSQNTLRKWIQAGRVLVDGKKIAHANVPVQKGARITVGPKVHFLKNGAKVLYQDDALIVLEKPEGLLSVATDFDDEPSLHAQLKRAFPHERILPVHRLDRDTSGIILFAHAHRAQVQLKKQFEAHAIQKQYAAIVEGKLEDKKGTWQSYLEEDALYTVHSKKEADQGKLAITEYERIAEKGGKTLLRLRPVTGRKHQLRVHCQKAGVPILGDKRYGSGKGKRLYLHAEQITFTHPLTDKRMTFTAPLPLAFTELF